MNDSQEKSIRKPSYRKGQSIVETALLLPILLIILSGVLEFGFIFTHYLAATDATRNSARFSSDSQFDISDSIKDCNATRDFYRQTACLALAELRYESPTISLCLPNPGPTDPILKHCPRVFSEYDDIVISIFSVENKGGGSWDIKRLPNGYEEGWSYAVDRAGESQDPSVFTRSAKHKSRFSSADVMTMLDSEAPNTGLILLELNYTYWQILALPWFTMFVPDPIEMHPYAVWSLVSAEPTPTPK